MINGRTILAIVPARGGSKRIPGKNLKDLCGKPMIHWTVDVAKESKYLDKIVVSTEDQQIVQAVSNKGIDIVTGPEELAGDRSSVFLRDLPHFGPIRAVRLRMPTASHVAPQIG